MPLTVTCSCGALLEIDDKFTGQVIHCPDCNRPLDTASPISAPTTTSGYTLASFILALVGAFTVIGTIAAILCGVIGLKQIRRSPERVGGKRFAQAGIILGVAGTLITMVLLSSAEFVRIDGLLRAIESAGDIDYLPDGIMPIERSGAFDPARSATIKVPSKAWGRLTYMDPNRDKTDDLILVDVWQDAYIVCLTKWLEGNAQTLEECRQEGLQQFLQSDLITRVLGRNIPDASAGEERQRRQLPGTEAQDFYYDVRLSGIDWTFFIRVVRDGNRLATIAGGARRQRFARLEKDIILAIDSFTMEK